MLHKPSDGEQIYEVSLYNRIVRALVKQNRSHALFDDHWADSQRHDVVACDESEARRMVSERFKADDGFVIEGVALAAI
ncbi:MAG: hypothetical protein VW405_03370 [Rhodospirillaceae bacterium]